MDDVELLRLAYEKRKYLLIVENRKKKQSAFNELGKYFIIPSLFIRSPFISPISSLVYLSITTKLVKKIRERMKANIYIATREQVSGLVFPGTGRPQLNMLYVCNPMDPKRYYHINNFHDEMENNKVNEIIYLLQSLCATEINVSLENARQKDTAADASVDHQGSSIHTSKSASQSIKYHGVYDPKHPPFIPDDLYWYDGEQQWKNITIQRMSGELKTFEFEIGIENDFGMSAKIYGQFKRIHTVKLGGDYHTFQKKHLTISGVFKEM